MSRNSKRKGSHYEREFVQLVQDAGLPAHRVPLSGAMGGRFADDVVVADEWRIECKYRSDGSGFKRLYDWLAGEPRLAVLDAEDGEAMLWVQTLDSWVERRRAELDEVSCTVFRHSKTSSSSWATLRGWIGEADYLAVRMPRMPWLVIEFSSELASEPPRAYLRRTEEI